MIADSMIKGYESLNENIKKTSNLISDVFLASKEQLLGIEQINDAVNNLDKQTQENVIIANKTNDIAKDITSIANEILEDSNKNKFEE